jgi:hypothetical protein
MQTSGRTSIVSTSSKSIWSPGEDEFSAASAAGGLRCAWSRPNGAALESVVERLKSLKLTIRNAPLATGPLLPAMYFTAAPGVEEILIARHIDQSHSRNCDHVLQGTEVLISLQQRFRDAARRCSGHPLVHAGPPEIAVPGPRTDVALPWARSPVSDWPAFAFEDHQHRALHVNDVDAGIRLPLPCGDVTALRQNSLRRSGPPRTHAIARRRGTVMRCRSRPSQSTDTKAPAP